VQCHYSDENPVALNFVLQKPKKINRRNEQSPCLGQADNRL